MSRIGKRPVTVPASVTMTRDGNLFSFKGRLGEGSCTVPDCISVVMEGTDLHVTPKDSTRFARAMWGTVQRTLSDIVKGVSDGFTVNLDLVGVGYKAAVAGSTLTMQLGYSHDVVYEIPAGVSIRCDKPTQVSITANSKQKVGAIAALLRSYRPPEPYKGKGVIRAGEFIVRKEGKKK
ncbi:MAG: 50S ribosomal protein L6 [Holosporales bacterium]|nr:50S ribosomal protein L6 [Holosporales bacterium]